MNSQESNPSDTWQFYNPVKLYFGDSTFANYASQQPTSERTLLVTTPGMTKRGMAGNIMAVHKTRYWEVFDQVRPNPELDYLDALIERYRRMPIDSIIALGGGSAIDTGKILAAFLRTDATFTLRRYFTTGTPLPKSIPVSLYSIPTTSGTGSEVTPFATVWDSKTATKQSISSPMLFSKAAFLEPKLTWNLPWAVTLSTGLDALCQALESIWNRNANPITLELGMHAAHEAFSTLSQGTKILESPQLRNRLMKASLLAGLAISHTRTALCHSISYPITSLFNVPHGLACAFTIPAVLDYNSVNDDGRIQRLSDRMGFCSINQLKSSIIETFEQLEVRKAVLAQGVTTDKLLEIGSRLLTPDRSENNIRTINAESLQILLSHPTVSA